MQALRVLTCCASLSFLLCILPACHKELNESLIGTLKPGLKTGDVSEATATGVTREYYIAPNVTDSKINTVLSNHFASVKEGVTLKNVLFVFFPGTYRNPTVCKATTQKAASLGFHSIGLMYDNRVAGNPLCSATGDVTCHSRARREVIDGIDRHPKVSVNASNSVINRLYKLLVYLNSKHPTQGWGQYMLNGKPNWSKIIVAGHSQGGAIAGVIGKYYPVKKVIMFSMIDYLNNGKIPDWELLSANRAKFFALTHTADELVPYPKVKTTWTAMKMDIYNGRINVDWNAYPYSNSHTLITSRIPTTTNIDKFHNSTGVDSYIPKTSAGKYVYDKAWEYLLTK